MNPFRKIYYSLTPKGRLVVRKIFYAPIDLWEGITGRRDDMTPKRGDIYVGSGDFRSQGRRLARLMIDLTGLQEDHAVLDIGSGIGRLAVGLTEILSPRARYEGFDVVKKGVDWCDSHITPKFPNFRFRFVDLQNDLYNLDTDARANTYVFPYADESFDRVVLTSVFTHMLPEDVENYLAQIARVLRPGGKCMATFFFVDDFVQQRMSKGECYFDFRHDRGDHLLLDAKVREADVAYRKETIEDFLKKAGLTIEQSYRGSWTKAEDAGPDFQDILVLKKF